MILTGIPPAPCTHPYGDYMLSLSMQNKQDWARLHSYELQLMAEPVDSSIRAGPWQKVGLIRKVRCCLLPPRPLFPKAWRPWRDDVHHGSSGGEIGWGSMV